MELVKATINGRALQFLKLPSSTVSNALLYAGYTQEDPTTEESSSPYPLEAKR